MRDEQSSPPFVEPLWGASASAHSGIRLEDLISIGNFLLSALLYQRADTVWCGLPRFESDPYHSYDRGSFPPAHSHDRLTHTAFSVPPPGCELV